MQSSKLKCQKLSGFFCILKNYATIWEKSHSNIFQKDTETNVTENKANILLKQEKKEKLFP